MCPPFGCPIWRTASLPSTLLASACAAWPTCSSWMDLEAAARRGRGQDLAGSWGAVTFLGSVAPSPSWGMMRWLWVPLVRAGTLLSGGQFCSGAHPQGSPPCPSNCGLGGAHPGKLLSSFEPSRPASSHAACLPQDRLGCGYQQRSTDCAVKAQNRPLSSEIHQNSFSPGSRKAEPCSLGQPALVQPQTWRQWRG